MNSNKVLIIEGEKSNLNEFTNLTGKTSKYNFLTLKAIIIFFPLIIIFFLLSKLEKKFNYIINFSENNNFLNQKIQFLLFFIKIFSIFIVVILIM
jgi:hypothetical protein